MLFSAQPHIAARQKAEISTHTPHVCILGGGFGGLYTALYFQRRCQRAQQACVISLVEPQARFTFTPLLYELITDELRPWEVVPSYGELLQGTEICHYATVAEQFDPATGRVRLATGDSLVYDYLVIATGSQRRLVDVPGQLDYTYGFRRWADVEALEARLHRLETGGQGTIRVSVIGGGPSGVELACKLADRLGVRGQLQLVELGATILKSFPRRIQRAALQALTQRRVTVRPLTGVVAVAADTITLETDHQATAEPTDLVIWVAGTQATPWVGVNPPMTTLQGRCEVEPTLQLKGYPNLFVVGDQAQMPWQQHRSAPQTAQAAYQAAAIVAHNLLASMQHRSLKPFRYFHLGDMMALGHGDALIFSFGLLLRGRLAAVIRQGVYLLRLPTSHHRWQVARYRCGRIRGWLRNVLW